jgi:hypothetical protein
MKQKILLVGEFHDLMNGKNFITQFVGIKCLEMSESLAKSLINSKSKAERNKIMQPQVNAQVHAQVNAHIELMQQYGHDKDGTVIGIDNLQEYENIIDTLTDILLSKKNAYNYLGYMQRAIEILKIKDEDILQKFNEVNKKELTVNKKREEADNLAKLIYNYLELNDALPDPNLFYTNTRDYMMVKELEEQREKNSDESVRIDILLGCAHLIGMYKRLTKSNMWEIAVALTVRLSKKGWLQYCFVQENKESILNDDQMKSMQLINEADEHLLYTLEVIDELTNAGCTELVLIGTDDVAFNYKGADSKLEGEPQQNINSYLVNVAREMNVEIPMKEGEGLKENEMKGDGHSDASYDNEQAEMNEKSKLTVSRELSILFRVSEARRREYIKKRENVQSKISNVNREIAMTKSGMIKHL